LNSKQRASKNVKIQIKKNEFFFKHLANFLKKWSVFLKRKSCELTFLNDFCTGLAKNKVVNWQIKTRIGLRFAMEQEEKKQKNEEVHQRKGRIIVRNLVVDINEKALRKLFAPFGEIVDVFSHFI
jgi:hypothetical protein